MWWGECLNEERDTWSHQQEQMDEHIHRYKNKWHSEGLVMSTYTAAQDRKSPSFLLFLLSPLFFLIPSLSNVHGWTEAPFGNAGLRGDLKTPCRLPEYRQERKTCLRGAPTRAVLHGLHDWVVYNDHRNKGFKGFLPWHTLAQWPCVAAWRILVTRNMLK